MLQTLVTGANSFVAAHIINELISKGHTVVGSLRHASSGDAILTTHPEWKNGLSFVEVEDYAAERAWDDVFKKHNIDYVIHVAAPLLDDPKNTDYDRDYIKPSVDGNISLLRSAKQFSKNLKAIAVTGSVNSITTGSPEELAKPLTNETWNSLSQDDARKANNAYISYCSSKKEAELAIWHFLETEHPSFAVTVFLPALIFGPPIQPVKSIKHLNFSCAYFYGLINGSQKETPKTMFPSYIDVRDLAVAHVKALTTTAAHNHRYLIGGARWTNLGAVEVIKALVEKGKLPKDLEDRLPVTPGEDVDIPVAQVGADEGNNVLGMKFRSLDDTVRDMVLRILALEREEQA